MSISPRPGSQLPFDRVSAALAGFWRRCGRRLAAAGRALAGQEPVAAPVTAESVDHSQALLATMHQHALVSIADARGRITAVNDAFCRLSGYRRDELVGADHRIVNSGCHPRAFWRDMWRAVRQGQAWRGEICNRAKDGTLYWVDSIITPFRDRHGHIAKYVSVRFDITPLKALQRQLEEREAFLDRSTALSGVGGVSADLQTGAVTWTRQCYRIFDVDESVQPTMALMEQLATGQTREAMKSAARNGTGARRGFEVEARMATARGRTAWIRSVGVIVFEGDRPLRIDGAIQDVTARKMAEQELRTAHERLALATGAAGIGIWEWDIAGNQLHWDAQMYRLFGRDPDCGLPPFEVWGQSLHHDDGEAADLQRRSIEGDGRTVETDFRIVLPTGEIRHLQVAAQIQRDATGAAVRMVGLNMDITHRKSMESQLKTAARYDKLTGLANRDLFMARLQKTIARVQGGEQSLYGALFLDFDRFKLVNDTLGHDAGDELLRQIARRLRRELRASDTDNDDARGNVVSRFGGDEFVLLINDLRTPDDALRIAERLLSALTPVYDILGSEVHSSASIGIVIGGPSYGHAEEVVRDADVAMYEAKRAGRGCSVVFNEVMHTRLARHVQIETSLRRAIGGTELHVVYQPIVELATGRMVSAEALVRWNHPVLGALAPAEFIPIAEESGLIIALDEWVLKEACRAMASWHRQDPQRAPRTISVNMSRAALALGPRLIEHLQAALQGAGLPAHWLQLEVTEREVMRDPGASLKLMHDLQGMGVKLAMDDFGSGTSSLGLLRQFPFDTIKIDRSFVQDLSGNEDVLAVIHATIQLVENLHMASLVEGIEDAAQVAILQSLGCRYAQGYLFSRPVAADQLLDAIRPRVAASEKRQSA